MESFGNIVGKRVDSCKVLWDGELELFPVYDYPNYEDYDVIRYLPF
jgi:hypothetical protein